MGLYDNKTDQQVAQSGSMDSGFCNPIKIGMAHEAQQDAISELMDRGYSQCEARHMVNDD